VIQIMIVVIHTTGWRTAYVW